MPLSINCHLGFRTYAKDKYADGYPAVLAAFASAVQAVQKKGKSACEAALGFDPKAATPAQLEAALLERMRREFHYVA